MNILLIGGTGNLSADCALSLHRHGHRILVLTRGTTPVPSEYEAVIADRRDSSALRAALGSTRIDGVVNFLGFEVADVETDFEIFKDGIQHYLFISSATVYAKPHRQLPLTEEAPLGNPFSEYARKKQACEGYLTAREKEDGFPVTIVRPSHTYSHRWVPNPISSGSFTYASRIERGRAVIVPDDGEGLWTLTAASDFAVGLAGLVGNEEAIGEVFHITSDEALPWNRIVKEIADALGVKSPEVVPVPTDVLCRLVPRLEASWKGDKSNPGVFDNAKIKRFVPGFSCRKSFRDGVRESVAWLRAHPEFQNLNPEIDEICDRVIQAWEARPR